MGTFDGLFTATKSAPTNTTSKSGGTFDGLFTKTQTTVPQTSKLTSSAPTQDWNGQKIPANISTKNLVSYDSSTGNKTFKLPEFNGGGVYTEDINGKLVKEGHTTYGGIAPVSGMQRDDIIPAGLGGTNSNKGNIKLVPNDTAHAEDIVETQLSKDVKSGKIQPKAAINSAIAQKSEIASQPQGFWAKVGNFFADAGDIAKRGATQGAKIVGQGAGDLSETLTGSRNVVQGGKDVATSIPKAFEQVGLGLKHQEMGATAGTIGGKKVPSTIPNPFQVALEADAEIPDAIKKVAFGTLIAPLLGASAQVKQQFGGEGQIDLSKIGIPKVDSFSRNVQARIDNGMPIGESIFMEVPNIIAAGMGLDALATKGSLKLGDMAQEKTSTPITFKDMQNITTGKENLVAPEVLDAYKQATTEHPELLGQIKKGTIEVPTAPKATLFSNFLKNAATRPISEIANLFDTFGEQIKTTTPPLLTDGTQPFAHELNAPKPSEVEPFAHETAPSATAPFAHEISEIKPTEPSVETPKETTVYRAQEKGTTGDFYTTDRSVAEKYAGTKSQPEIVTKDISDLNLKEVSAKDMLNESENPETLKNFDGLKFTHPVTGSEDVRIFPKEEKIAKASSDINENLVKKGFEAIPDSELSKYNPTTKKEQIQKISELMTSDLEKAKSMALGEIPVENGILPQPLFNAIEAHAIETNDIQTLRGLAKSPVAKQLSEAGQALGSHGYNDNANSVVDKIQEVVKSREKSSGKKFGSKSKAKSELKIELKKTIPKIQDWSQFIESIKC